MIPAKSVLIAKLEGHIAIWGNIILFAFKFWVGMVTGSVAIMADAWHTLSDSLSSVLLVAGIKVAERPPDQEHPFGHGRAEVVVTLVIGVMLAVIAFDFGWKGVEQLIHPVKVEYGWLGVLAMVITIVVKEGMAQYAYWGARKTGLGSLRADGHHHRSDAISSVIILVGIIFGGDYLWMDGALSLCVALIILHASWSVFADAANALLGAHPTPELEAQIRQICNETHGRDTDVHHIHLHRYGEHTELTFHLRFEKDTPLQTAHDWAHGIEKVIVEKLNMTSTIHVEPLDDPHIKVKCRNPFCAEKGYR